MLKRIVANLSALVRRACSAVQASLPSSLDMDLLQAARTGNLDGVKRLLHEGADANARNDYQATPLILAAENDQVEIAKYLLEHGADIHAKDYGGRDALIQAIRRGHVDTIIELRPRPV